MAYDFSTGAKAPKANRATHNWTDARVATLKKLWAEGWSGGEIAKQLGGVTRNAVIGKVHRLGLGPRTPCKPVKTNPPKSENPHPLIAERRPKPSPRLVAKPKKKKTGDEVRKPHHIPLEALTPSTCRWPYRHEDGSWSFCGCDVAPGSVYCAHHKAMATRKVGKVDERPAKQSGHTTKGLSLEAIEWCAA